MSASTIHPSPDLVRRFYRGALPDHESVLIREHVDGCAECRLFAALDTKDPTGFNSTGESPSATRATDRHSSPATVPSQLIDHPKYEIINWIGSGGMGTVFKARHRAMNRVVALKVMQNLKHSSTVVRFQREIEAAAKLHHTNIVMAHDADRAGDLHFLIMEFIEGESLFDRIRRHGPLSIRDWHCC